MAAEKKKTTADAKSGKGAAKTPRNAQGGLAKPVKPDSTLAAVVGAQPLTRAELTRKVWDYVKKNNLQDPKDKRSIRADAKLKPVFGGKDKVTMFEMTKLVNQHVSAA